MVQAAPRVLAESLASAAHNLESRGRWSDEGQTKGVQALNREDIRWIRSSADSSTHVRLDQVVAKVKGVIHDLALTIQYWAERLLQGFHPHWQSRIKEVKAEEPPPPAPVDEDSLPTSALMKLLVGIEQSTISGEGQGGGGAPPSGDPRLNELRNRGFISLADELEAGKGYPWDTIRQLGSPQLMEQLITLWRICEGHPDQTLAREVMDYALHRAVQTIKPRAQDPQTILPNLTFVPLRKAKEVSILVGKLIVVMDADPTATVALLKDEALIHEAFSARLTKVADDLLAHYQSHQKAGLQEPDRAVSVFLPRELAKLLITSTGRVNFAIIGEMQDKFLSLDRPQAAHEKSMIYALQLLQRSPRLRDKFDAIVKPENPNSAAFDVVRATLGMRADEEVTDVSAKRAALTAIMSHLRQGSVGSCFATFLAIDLLSSHLDRCLDDFSALIQKGQLTRIVDGVEVPFPFLLRMSNDNIKMEITFDREGKVYRRQEEHGLLWEAPGLVAACAAVGIQDAQGALMAAADALFASTKGQRVMTNAKTLIEKVCELQADRTGTSVRKLYRKASFAFEAQTVCPLLRVWEYTIAGMSEADASGLVRQRMVMSSMRAMYAELRPMTDLKEEDRKAYLKELSYLLCHRSRVQYDADVPHRHLSADGHSSEGAFVLYDTHGSSDAAQWQRCDNPEKYGEFMQRISAEAWENLRKARGSDWNPRLEAVRDELQPKIAEEPFLTSALLSYSMMNVLYPDPLKNYAMIEHAPWMDKTGNNTMRTLMVYLEKEYPFATETILPTDAKHLLRKVIEIASKSSQKVQQQFKENPGKLVPVRTPGCHAFNLMLGNPRLAQAWQSGMKADDWIAANILTPGMAVAQSPMPETTRDALIDYCRRLVMSKPHLEAFEQIVAAFPADLTIAQYRTKLLEVVVNLEGKGLSHPERLSRRVDSRIAEYLPQDLKARLREATVHFADTNWNDGVHELHFCFLVNPGSGLLEIWQVQDDDCEYVAMDQRSWLLDQEWEFFIDPANLIPQNELRRDKIMV